MKEHMKEETKKQVSKHLLNIKTPISSITTSHRQFYYNNNII